VHDRVEEDLVVDRVGDQPRGLDLSLVRVLLGDADRLEVQRDADRGARREGGAQRLGRQAVPEQQVMRGRVGGVVVDQAGGVHADPVSEVRDHLRLVERDPAGDPVAERVGDRGRVVGEPLRGVPRRPAAEVLQGLRQIPVVQRGGAGDAALPEGVEQPLVVIQPGLVDLSGTGREDPRPGDREPVGGQAE
jgi:hypothetical protein